MPTEPWYHHLRDVLPLAIGYLAARAELPDRWTSDALSAALGIDPAKYQRHTAMDDARWALDQHDIIMGCPRRSGAWGDVDIAQAEPSVKRVNTTDDGDEPMGEVPEVTTAQIAVSLGRPVV